MNSLELAIALIFVFLFSNGIFVNADCKPGKDVTDYVRGLINAVRSNEHHPIKLPRRLLADIYLKRGNIYGLENVMLGEKPAQLSCFNSTVGAIQPKLIADNVTFEYEWVFGDDESTGRAYLKPQTVYMDADIQLDENQGVPEIFGFYVTTLTKTKFDVEVVSGKDHSSSADIIRHVMLIARMALLRDIDTSILVDFRPKIEMYLSMNPFSLD